MALCNVYAILAYFARCANAYTELIICIFTRLWLMESKLPKEELIHGEKEKYDIFLCCRNIHTKTPHARQRVGMTDQAHGLFVGVGSIPSSIVS
jgi:hypothetical protein